MIRTGMARLQISNSTAIKASLEPHSSRGIKPQEVSKDSNHLRSLVDSQVSSSSKPLSSISLHRTLEEIREVSQPQISLTARLRQAPPLVVMLAVITHSHLQTPSLLELPLKNLSQKVLALLTSEMKEALETLMPSLLEERRKRRRLLKRLRLKQRERRRKKRQS